MNLYNHNNIFFDENSEFSYENLNESLFIEILFKNLTEIMQEEFSQYDFFVFSNHKSDKLPQSISYQSERKKVLLYFSDESGEDPSPYSDGYYSIFKAYIGTNAYAPNVFPLPIGYVKEVPQLPVKPIQERSYNVFYRGNLNSNRIDFYRNFSRFKYFLPSKPNRFHGFYRKLLLNIQSDFSSYFPESIIFFNNSFKGGFTPQQYGKILAESKIVLCPKGFDRTESFRHFEAMRAGCILISERLPNTEFYKGSPIIEIDNWKKGLSVVKDLLADIPKMEALQRETISWWENKCSERSTAEYMWRKLNDLKSPS
jgi:hypothetical protein